MSENKFIKHLKGEDTAKSVLEIKNQRTTTSFANMPDGNTSNANDVFSDHRGDTVGVLKGTENWKLDGQTLVETTTVYGDGRDFSNSTYEASGNGLWVDASCTFAASKRFAPNTKFVLKLCGHDLVTVINHTVDFTLIVKFGASNLISKTFTVTEQAFNFCKEFAIDFAESNSSAIKADAGSTMQIQLLCSDANARAVIYNGMTVFTALQRRVDGDAVASDKKTFDEVVQDIDDINDEIDQIHEDIDDLEEYVDDTFVKKAGDTMTGALSILRTSSSNTALITIGNGTASSRRWNFLPSYNATSLSVYSGTSETGGYRFTLNGFVPASNNVRDLGSSSLKWKAVYAGVLNNGANLVIPTKGGTLATMADVELAARSGTQLTEQGVWYAKMYAATVAPAAENGTNYADFSQVDGQGNPIIVTYNRVNGVWVQDQTITPPAEYDGYVIVTSKIWDIAEQTGQQGGRVLWNHTSKEFTPYPQIISFEDINVTGNSTVIMPQNPGANQIVNKDYVDEAIAAIPTPTVDVTQSIDAEIVGTLTITDNSVVSGFSANNYLKLPGVFELGSSDTSSFEIGAAFIGGNIVHGEANVLLSGQQINSTLFAGLSISFGSSSDRKLRVQIRGSGATQTIVGTTDLGTEKVYIKLQYDGANYNLLLSNDGSTYTQETTVAATQLATPAVFYIGHGGSSTVNTVDLSGCYIKKNGVIIWQGMDAPGLHQRVVKGHEVIAFQAPTAGDNYTWYRKYADGWVEQGGSIDSAASGTYTVAFPVTMADTHYTILKTMSTNSSNGAQYNQISFFNKTTTSAETNTAGVGFSWQVSGMAA